jgi:hypothetical protein
MFGSRKQLFFAHFLQFASTVFKNSEAVWNQKSYIGDCSSARSLKKKYGTFLPGIISF